MATTPCFGTPYPDVHKTGATQGTEFEDPTTGSLVFLTTTSYDDAKGWVDQEVRNELGPLGTKCRQSVGEQLASLAHQTDYVAGVERPPKGVPPSVKSVTRIQYTDNSKTPPIVVRQDSFILAAGRFEVGVNFQGRSAMEPDVEKTVLTALDSRLTH